jgi:hypothetical protein
MRRPGKTTSTFETTVTRASAPDTGNVKKKIRAKLLALGGTIVLPGRSVLDAAPPHNKRRASEKKSERG